MSTPRAAPHTLQRRAHPTRQEGWLPSDLEERIARHDPARRRWSPP